MSINELAIIEGSLAAARQTIMSSQCPAKGLVGAMREHLALVQDYMQTVADLESMKDGDGVYRPSRAHRRYRRRRVEEEPEAEAVKPS